MWKRKFGRYLEYGCKHRGREENPAAFEEIRDFENNVSLNTQWKAFEPAQSAGLEFSEALVRLETFLKSVYETILGNTDWAASWICEDREWNI